MEPMKSAPSAWRRFISALSAALHRSDRNVGAGAFLANVALNIAQEAGHTMGQGGMDVDPVAEEFLVAEVPLAGEERDALDHGPVLFESASRGTVRLVPGVQPIGVGIAAARGGANRNAYSFYE